MDNKKIGAFLRDLRKEHNLTQEELGEKLGATNKTISRWETGTYMPPVDILLQMSKLYGVSVNEILSGERLDTRDYQPKAEENIAITLKQSQKDSRGIKIAIACCLVVILIISILLGLRSCFLGLFPHNSVRFFDDNHLEEHLISDLPKPKNKIADDYGSSVYVYMTEQEFNQYVASVYKYILSCNFKRLGTRGEVMSGLIGIQYYANTDVSQLSDFYNATAEAGVTPFNGYIFVWADGTNDDTVWTSHYLEMKYLNDKNQMYMEMCYRLYPYYFAE